ncbi:MAG TPA: hypothetical protein VMT05_09450 [Terriglobales bacterium]|jgi:hypothetical protein|nr:hypothetical protein [Terriglobales bacterium]
MGIDNIKPPGGAGLPVDPSAETPSGPTRQSNFAEAKDRLQTSSSAEPVTPALRVVSQFSRIALEDPEKRQAMVRACVSELIDSGQPVTGPLSGTERESLLDFLSADPLFRSQIETYLQKVLV